MSRDSGSLLSARLSCWRSSALRSKLCALRPLQQRTHIEVALVTLGLGIILGQTLIFFYGGEARSVDAPPSLAGSVAVFGLTYPVYRLFLIAMGLGSCGLLALWLNFYDLWASSPGGESGPVSRADDGVNADRLSLLVTSLSAAFAGVAGVLAGPYLSVDPAMDVTMIVSCLIIVVIGGAGSIAGAIVAASSTDSCRSPGSVFLPDLAALAPYALLMVVLLIAPRGIGRGRAPA